jgi:hypothetical protein
MGSGPPPVGGNPRPRCHGPRKRLWNWFLWRVRKRLPLGHQWMRQQAAWRRERARRRYPSALKKEEAGILQFDVSSISPRAPSISRGSHSLFRFLADRVTPTIPALALSKVPKLGTPATTRWRSERAPRTTASAVAAGESSCVAIEVVRPLSYGPPWAHYLGGYQGRLLGGPLGLPGLRCTTLDGVKHRDYGGEVPG